MENIINLNIQALAAWLWFMIPYLVLWHFLEQYLIRQADKHKHKIKN